MFFSPAMVTIPYAGFCQPVSSLSHYIGAAVAVPIFLFTLFRSRGRPLQMLAVTVFAGAVIFQLTMSGLYHQTSFFHPDRNFFRRLDLAAIWLLITASFVSGHVILFRTFFWRWGMVIIVAALALGGLSVQAVYYRDIPHGVYVMLYLGLGWLGMVSVVQIVREYDFSFIYPIGLGGGAYTIGAILDFVKWPILIPGWVGHHEIFHIFVLLGLSCHWWFLYQCCGGGLEARYPHLLGTGKGPDHL